MASKSLSVGRGWAQGSYVQEPTDSQGGARRGSNLLAEPDTGGGALSTAVAPQIRFPSNYFCQAFSQAHVQKRRGHFSSSLGPASPPGPHAELSPPWAFQNYARPFSGVFTLPRSTSPLVSQPWEGGGSVCLPLRSQGTSKSLMGPQDLGFSSPLSLPPWREGRC